MVNHLEVQWINFQAIMMIHSKQTVQWLYVNPFCCSPNQHLQKINGRKNTCPAVSIRRRVGVVDDELFTPSTSWSICAATLEWAFTWHLMILLKKAISTEFLIPYLSRWKEPKKMNRLSYLIIVEFFRWPVHNKLMHSVLDCEHRHDFLPVQAC